MGVVNDNFCFWIFAKIGTEFCAKMYLVCTFGFSVRQKKDSFLLFNTNNSVIIISQLFADSL